MVLDSELSGVLDLSGEVGSTALSLAEGPGFDDVRPTRRNILRGLAGVGASTGPDLALSHESVRAALRGLPELFGRPPELEALLR